MTDIFIPELWVALAGMLLVSVIMGWCWLMRPFEDTAIGFFIAVIGLAAVVWIPGAYIIHYYQLFR